MTTWLGHLTVSDNWTDATAQIPTIANALCSYEMKTSGGEALIVFGGAAAPAEIDAGNVCRFSQPPVAGEAAKVWVRRLRSRRPFGGNLRLAVTDLVS